MHSLAGGAKRLTYRVGPFDVIPGQNSIGLRPIEDRPQVDGYVTRIRPNLTYLDGSVPRVDVIHLHHAVWVNTSGPNNAGFGAELFFAAGEEKTTMQLPKGYGYPLRATDGLFLNHMIHNLTPNPTQVYMTYQIDFAPKGSAAARGILPARPVWMDVERGKSYPVFNVRKGSGRHGRFTYPDQAKNPYGAGRSGTSGWSTGRACWSPPAATCIPVGSTRTSSCGGATGPPGCSGRRRSTTSPPAPSRGTWP